MLRIAVYGDGNPDVVIIGGGLAGLTAALHLIQRLIVIVI